MAMENETGGVDGAKTRAFNALAKFLDALTDLAGPLARMLREELEDRAADKAKRQGKS